MNPGGGGISRLAPCLTASLFIHLAIILAVIAATRREKTEVQGPMRLSVEFVEPPGVRETLPAAAKPRPERAPGPRRVPPPTRPAAPTVMKQQPKGHEGTPQPMPPLPLPAVPGGRGNASPAGKTALPAPGSTMQFIDGTGGRAPAGGSSGGGPAALGRQGGGAAGTAGRSASPSNGGGVPSAGLGAYQALLKRIIEAHKEYPLAARRMRQEGSCLRRFTISRGGSLKKVEPLSSCGHPFLDDAATRAITGAGTFPPLPDDFRGEEATFTISIKFTLENE